MTYPIGDTSTNLFGFKCFERLAGSAPCPGRAERIRFPINDLSSFCDLWAHFSAGARKWAMRASYAMMFEDFRRLPFASEPIKSASLDLTKGAHLCGVLYWPLLAQRH